MVGCKISKLMGCIPAPPLVLGELCKIPLGDVRKQIAAAMGDPAPEEKPAPTLVIAS